MKTKIIPSILLITGFLIGATALSTFAQAPQNPPSCPEATPGCNPPINEGNASQTKKGPLILNAGTGSSYATDGLRVWGNSILAGNVDIIGKIKINDGTTIPAGSVLTSVNGDGVGSWVDSSGSSSFGTNFQVFNDLSPIQYWDAPSGINKVLIEAWGGGAGGKPGTCTGAGGPGKGGSAGGYGKGIYTVIPGTRYNITIGLGGSPNSSGGTSSFGSLITATGGTSSAGGTSAAPFSVTGSVGLQTSEVSGGTGGFVSGGGNGGRGGLFLSSTSYEAPTNGIVPGGGGGGGGLAGSGTSCFGSRAGSDGAAGRVVVWW